MIFDSKNVDSNKLHLLIKNKDAEKEYYNAALVRNKSAMCNDHKTYVQIPYLRILMDDILNFNYLT